MAGVFFLAADLGVLALGVAFLAALLGVLALGVLDLGVLALGVAAFLVGVFFTWQGGRTSGRAFGKRGGWLLWGVGCRGRRRGRALVLTGAALCARCQQRQHKQAWHVTCRRARIGQQPSHRALPSPWGWRPSWGWQPSWPRAS